jgi:hypothetical protein
VLAALVDAGNGLVNDTVRNITWVADASLSGAQTWDNLASWAENLVYAGYSDWRLASMSVAAGTPTGSAGTDVDCSSATEPACRDNELGDMHYYNLGGQLDELFILIRLAKEVQAFKSFSAYQFTVEQVASICRQNEGWLRSVTGKQGEDGQSGPKAGRRGRRSDAVARRPTRAE